MTLFYTLPNKEVFVSTDFGVQESMEDMTVVRGESHFCSQHNRQATLFCSDLLSGNPSIFNMVRVATWLATEYGIIVQFPFNDRTYRAYPFETYEEVLESYFYSLYASTQQQMAERITHLEKELADCIKTCDEEHITKKRKARKNIDKLRGTLL